MPTCSSTPYRTGGSGMRVFLRRGERLAAGAEKLPQQFAGAPLVDAAVNFRPMMVVGCSKRRGPCSTAPPFGS